MAIFIGNICLIYLYWFLQNGLKGIDRKNTSVGNFFVLLISLQLILLLALRGENIGIDTRSYISRFYKYGNMSWKDIFDNHQEIGFSVLLKSVNYFTDNVQWMLVASAFLTIVPISIIIKKYSSNIFLSFLLFIAFGYFGFTFSGIRQGIAMGILIYSYSYIRDKKLVLFLITVFLASLFHSSAIIFLPAYFVSQIKINKYSIVAISLSWFFVFVFKSHIYSFFETRFFSTPDNFYKLKQTSAYMWTIMMNVIAVVSIIISKEITKKNKYFEQLVMLMCTGSILTLFLAIGSNAKRISEYYCVFLILLIPEMNNAFVNPMLKSTINIMISIAVLGMFLWSINLNEYRIIPYKFFFQ